MNEPHDPNRTAADISSVPADSLDAGLAAGFGKPVDGASSVLAKLRPSLGDLRPVQLREAEGESAHVVKPKSDAMPAPAETGDRYQLAGEIARGGMGAVLRGRDVDLGRDLAIKVLLEKYVDRPEVARRFLEEAQIGGQLQHPGVVPVYDIGRFGDRPFFTMKLVKGQTLAALLSERTDPAADRPRLLGIALQVAQTLAYAHAKGVIHRDLKPANIMVGAFGEVQVMDWGLAKVLAEGGIADEERASREHNERADATTIRTARSSSSTGGHGKDTEAGSVLGTPAYMPPEQANGEVALLDRRADVFGLGAILCEVLTGKPPYVGRSAEEVRRKAANGDLADARSRLAGCGADADLITLTNACLSPEARDRPKDARAVADGLTAYLDGVQERLRRAELDRAAAHVKAGEERKRRKLTLALAAAVLALVTGSAVGGLYWQRQRAEQTRQDAELRLGVEAALEKATDLRQRARWPEAHAVLEQADSRLGANGPADLRSRVEQAVANVALVDRLEGIRLKRSTSIEGRFDIRSAQRDYPVAFQQAGLAAQGEDAAAVAERIQKSAIRTQLVAALDDWALIAPEPDLRKWLLEVARLADPDPWGDRFRDQRLWQDRSALQALANELLGDPVKLANMQPASLAVLGGTLISAKGNAVPVLAAGQALHRNDFWLNVLLGTALFEAKRADEAVGYFRAALAVRPDSVAAHNNLGNALRANKELDAAIKEYRAAIALGPKFARPHDGLGLALLDKEELDAAIEEFRAAIALDPKDAVPHNGLGGALYAKKELDAAIKEIRAAIALDAKYAAPHANLAITLRVQKELDAAIREIRAAIALDPKDALHHFNLGVALSDKKELGAAIREYRAAIAIDAKLAAAHLNLGIALSDKKELDGAIREYRAAIALDPTSALPHNALGNALQAKNELDGAIREYRAAIALDPKDAEPHNGLGRALYAKEELDAAIQEYRAAIALDAKYAVPHNNLGITLMNQKELDAAIREFRAAIALDATYALPHAYLGITLMKQKELDAAIREFRAAIALDPTSALLHNELGNALYAKEELDAAIQEFRAAIALDAKYAAPHNNLGVALRDKKELDAAIKECRAAIALDAKYAAPHANLGNILGDKMELDAAIREFRAAIALDPKDALLHNGLGVALLDKKELDAALQEFRAAIAIDPKYPDPHYNLGRALGATKELDAAIEEYRAAIALNPNYAEAHCNLGHFLRQQGHLANAADELRKGHEIGSKQPGWPYPSALWVRQAEQLVALDRKLLAVLDGKDKPADDSERLALAWLCRQPYKQLYAACCGFYAEAFAHDPKLAGNLQQQFRYSAACSAALAGCGAGKDADKPDDKERARLRQQALDWLRADLAAWTKQAESDKPAARQAVQAALQHWQGDAELAGLHNMDAVVKLPADEWEACAKLWADVAAVLKTVQQDK